MADLFDILNVNPAQSVQPQQSQQSQNLMQKIASDMGRNIQQAGGQDTRTQDQKVNSAAKGADTTTPEGLIAFAQKLDAVGESARAIQIRQMAAAKGLELQESKRATDLRQEESRMFDLLDARASSLNTPESRMISQAVRAGHLSVLDALERLEAAEPTAEDSKGRLRYVRNGHFVFEDEEGMMDDREYAVGSDGIARYLDDQSFVMPDDAAKTMEAEQLAAVARVREIEDDDLRASQADRAVLQHTGLIKKNINAAKALFSETYTGYAGVGAALANPDGNNAALHRILLTLKANIGFDQLMAMKAASPTGGALGAVNTLELESLQAALGSLDNKQTKAELMETLDTIMGFYDNLARNAEDWSALRESRESPQQAPPPSSPMSTAANIISGAPASLQAPSSLVLRSSGNQ
jgi:hypothetical protein